MKLRIKGNSIRIRLSRPEVDALATDGALQEVTTFPTGDFIYELLADASVTTLEARLAPNKITMCVPADLPAAWAASDTVGHENYYDTGDGKTLYLLLEKDFKCIDAPPHEDQSDNYDNPHTTC